MGGLHGWSPWEVAMAGLHVDHLPEASPMMLWSACHATHTQNQELGDHDGSLASALRVAMDTRPPHKRRDFLLGAESPELSVSAFLFLRPEGAL